MSEENDRLMLVALSMIRDSIVRLPLAIAENIKLSTSFTVEAIETRSS